LGQTPCNPPQASVVQIVTLASDAVISAGPRSTGSLLLVGLGVRHLSEPPERSAETRPFVEIGLGLAHAIGTGSIGLEARYQLAASSSDLPRWTIPMAITARFF